MGLRESLAGIYLRHAPQLGTLRKTPVLGDVVHYVSHKLLPSGVQVWRQIEEGAAKGLWMKVNPRTAAQLCRGEAETGIQKILTEHLRPGMVFYDGGANIGFFSLVAARLVGETGKVFAFEPESEIVERLRENRRRNGFSWIDVEEAALYSRSGQIRFYRASALASPDRGTGRVMEQETATEGISVRAIALDDFVREHPAPDLIKVDVEGAETEVLRGANNLLGRRRPMIVCELHSAECDVAVREILEQHSYSVRRLDENHIFATGR